MKMGKTQDRPKGRWAKMKWLECFDGLPSCSLPLVFATFELLITTTSNRGDSNLLIDSWNISSTSCFLNKSISLPTNSVQIEFQKLSHLQAKTIHYTPPLVRDTGLILIQSTATDLFCYTAFHRLHINDYGNISIL